MDLEVRAADGPQDDDVIFVQETLAGPASPNENDDDVMIIDYTNYNHSNMNIRNYDYYGIHMDQMHAGGAFEWNFARKGCPVCKTKQTVAAVYKQDAIFCSICHEDIDGGYFFANCPHGMCKKHYERCTHPRIV